MPFVNNTFTRQTVEYFDSFTPFEEEPGTTATDRIQQMVSYDVYPRSSPVVIDQIFGAFTTFEFDFKLRNMTTNVDLSVQIEPNPYFIVSTDSFTLSPGTTRTVNVSVNNTEVNQTEEGIDFISEFRIRVTNELNGTIGYINNALQPLTRRSLPERVEIR